MTVNLVPKTLKVEFFAESYLIRGFFSKKKTGRKSVVDEHGADHGFAPEVNRDL